MSNYIEVIMDWLDLYELRNFGIHSDTQPYTQKITTSESFFVEAKTNITEGEALEITLKLHKKSSDTITKTYETHVTNGAISDKFKIEDLAREEDVDINEIAAISAIAHYEDQEFKSNHANITRVLQSKQLKESGVLNDIAEKRVKKVFKKTSPMTQGEEVKLIQTALKKMKIDIGNDGVDGKFGSDGENAVKTFQANYTPTHKTHHQYDWAEEPDGVVGKNTLLAMDEALVEGWKYKVKDMNLSKTSLMKLIASKESKGSYSAYNVTGWDDNGKNKVFESHFNATKEYDIVNMTLSAIQIAQAKRTGTHKKHLFAVGLYQLISPTFDSAVLWVRQKANIDKSTQKYNQNFQDMLPLFFWESKVPPISKYFIDGNDVEYVAYRISKEWASAAVPKGRKLLNKMSSDGTQNYYGSDGLNKAHYSADKVIKALKETKKEIDKHGGYATVKKSILNTMKGL